MTPEQWQRLLDKLIARTTTSMEGWERSDIGAWILPLEAGSIVVHTRPGKHGLLAQLSGPAVEVRSRTGTVSYRLDADVTQVLVGADSPGALGAKEKLRQLADLLDAHDRELQRFVDDIIDEI